MREKEIARIKAYIQRIGDKLLQMMEVLVTFSSEPNYWERRAAEESEKLLEELERLKQRIDEKE